MASPLFSLGLSLQSSQHVDLSGMPWLNTSIVSSVLSTEQDLTKCAREPVDNTDKADDAISYTEDVAEVFLSNEITQCDIQPIKIEP